MQSLNIKSLIAKVPAADGFGLTSAFLINGSIHTVSDYELPKEVVELLEIVANAKTN